MPAVALIDGDIVAYRAASARSGAVGWNEDGDAPRAGISEDEAINKALDDIWTWTKAAGMTEAIVAISSRMNFRKVIMPSYKSNRKAAEKPVHLSAVLEAIREGGAPREVEWLEADDILGILATTDRYAGSVVVTVDKDLLTVPGKHFNPVTGVSRTVSHLEGNLRWLMQVLTGDAVDGYGGCPKIGPVKAAKLLGPGRPSWSSVVRAYESAGLNENDAIQTARVARILQREDYHQDTKEISLWTSKQPERFSLETGCVV
jgi:DNA polymerase-1